MNPTHQRILIIDPDHDQRTVMASFLQGEKYHVETGETLTDAIRKFAQENFKCIIIDVDLPDMKGYEAVPILKNLRPAVKVIMTSKTNSKQLEAKVREQDIFFYFIKSFGKEELKLAIQNAFRK